jgi:hypothetical protein
MTRLIGWLISASCVWLTLAGLFVAVALAKHVMPAWLAWSLVAVVAIPVVAALATLTQRIKDRLL